MVNVNGYYSKLRVVLAQRARLAAGDTSSAPFAFELEEPVYPSSFAQTYNNDIYIPNA